ncbi:hypothetical protein ACWGTO_28590 [Mesorhizobium sp. PL10]
MTEPSPPQNKKKMTHPRISGDPAILRAAVAQAHDRQLSREAVLREKLKASAVPLPPELFEEVAKVSGLEIDEVMTDHPGRKIWERYNSYLVSSRVFDRAFADLFKAIARFEEAVGRDIFDRSNELELQDIEADVQKELFAATSAAHSLVDHSRRIQKIATLAGHDAKRVDCLGDDGLHDFVIALRTLLHHLHAVEAGWNITNDFERGKTAGFMLRRRALQSAINQSKASFTAEQHKGIQRFMAAAPESIDVRAAFEEYQRRSGAFRSWFGEALRGDGLVALRDYERCIAENKKRSIRMMWNALVGNWLNWKEPPRLYNHLPRYLTSDEIAELYALPLRSREQIDRLIDLVDREQACDDALRERIHRLFQRVAPPDAVAT